MGLILGGRQVTRLTHGGRAVSRWTHGGRGGSLSGVTTPALRLAAYPLDTETRPAFYWFPYAASMISTQQVHSQLYGYWEMRVKATNIAKGGHIAAWLVRADNAWPPEVDILEIVNAGGGNNVPTTWFSSLHGEHGLATGEPYTNAAGHSLRWTNGVDVSIYHTVGLEWTSSHLRWFLDGVLIREEANYIHDPMYFMVSWEIGGDWPGDPDETTVWPMAFDLRYARAFTSKTAPTPAWELNVVDPAIGWEPGNNFAPFFVGWGARHLARNNDEGIKVADNEPSATEGLTYGEALAAMGGYGSGPFFHIPIQS